MRYAAISCLLALSGCQTPKGGIDPSELPSGAEALSLFGQPLFPPGLDEEARREREAKFAEAAANLAKNPEDPDAAIWFGRRSAYLGKFCDAVAIYTQALEKHPGQAKILRHRGHRYITLRAFDRAIADLERASHLIEGRPDEIEPDGLPNPSNAPTSTLHFNVWYHLGLAYYLADDLPNALRSYGECMKVSGTPDRYVATAHWLYMTLRRLRRESETKALLDPVRPEMEIVENHAYHQLLLVYRGETTPESALEEARRSSNPVDFTTVAYGVGNWHLANGRAEEAAKLFREILDRDSWHAFGHIAAEADCRRLGWDPKK